jgi:TNF receptor-associated factor 1
MRQSHIEPKNKSSALNNEENYSEIVESVNILAEGLSSLHDDNVQIHNNVARIHSNILEQQKQMEQLKSSVEESVQLIHATQINNNILQNEIETVKQMMNDMLSQSSNDGTFIWKITDVAKKISDAAAERQTSVYSPPFYSSPTGYKMCMRLYFNGDGNARRTHLSLFFVLMRGDYDAILQWPFSHKITFCLYDQTTTQRHIIDSFRPDNKSNSFQRPRSSMNIASGIPKFCPLTMIQQDNNPYVRDDCMFIRCIVDFASTPKTMLPYICSLNPGLPTIVQQAMIRAEIERRNSTESKKSDSQNSSPTNDDSK